MTNDTTVWTGTLTDAQREFFMTRGYLYLRGVFDGEDAKALEQDGWRIDYQKYSDEPGAHMPVRMRASSGETRVRIVVDQWQLGQ